MSRAVLNVTGGFNENLGPGAGTPWGSSEIQDLALRAMNAGFQQFYDPTLYAHHELMLTQNPDKSLRKKGRFYARGMGRVLKIHGFGIHHAVYWALRPIARILEGILLVHFRYTLYQKDICIGRLEGYFSNGE